MKENGTLFHYGNLSLRSISNVLTNDILFYNKSLRGFWLHNYLKHQKDNLRDIYNEFLIDLENNPNIYKTNITNVYTPDQFELAFKEYKSQMGKGKILFDFNIYNKIIN